MFSSLQSVKLELTLRLRAILFDAILIQWKINIVMKAHKSADERMEAPWMSEGNLLWVCNSEKILVELHERAFRSTEACLLNKYPWWPSVQSHYNLVEIFVTRTGSLVHYNRLLLSAMLTMHPMSPTHLKWTAFPDIFLFHISAR